MITFVTVIHLVAIVLLVLVILLQSGKGAEISASFGGSSQTVFGTAGGANFFTRFTAVTATVFMGTSIVLTLLNSQTKKSVFEGVSTAAPVTTQSSAPAANPAAASAQPVPPVGTAPTHK